MLWGTADATSYTTVLKLPQHCSVFASSYIDRRRAAAVICCIGRSLTSALLPLDVLVVSRETHTLAVACNDVGRFVEFHPHGRYIVSDLRGKELVMRLMQHPDADVQKRALLAVQKIMLPVSTQLQLHLPQSVSISCWSKGIQVMVEWV